MGIISAGVGIKTKIENYTLDDVVKNLFENEFLRTSEIGDIRNNDWIVVSKTKDFFHIQSSDYAEQFFNDSLSKNIQKLNQIFKDPELIFAFEQYDSGGTYSYAIIKNGVLKRQFRSVSYEIKIDKGELEQIEVQWKEADIKEYDLGDGEKEIILTNKVTGQKCDKGSEPEVILNHLLFHLLKIEHPDFSVLEYSYYKKSDLSTSDTVVEKNENKTGND